MKETIPKTITEGSAINEMKTVREKHKKTRHQNTIYMYMYICVVIYIYISDILWMIYSHCVFMDTVLLESLMRCGRP